MSKHKKNEIALYITTGTFILGVGAFTGDYITYFKMLLCLFGFIGLAFSYYKFVIFILEKLFPNSETTTKGAHKTTTINFKYE